MTGICIPTSADIRIEVAGRRDEVLKILPPLTTTREELVRGMDIIREATIAVLNEG